MKRIFRLQSRSPKLQTQDMENSRSRTSSRRSSSDFDEDEGIEDPFEREEDVSPKEEENQSSSQ